MPDHFELFGIDRSFLIDATSLEHRFHELQAVSHPDRHVNAGEERKLTALLSSSDINRAYRTLREPLARAKYVLSLYGYGIADKKQVPATLLMTVMEAQEKIAEIESASDKIQKVRLSNELLSIAEQLDGRLQTIDEERRSLERSWDLSMHPANATELNEQEKGLLARMTELIAERSYIDTLNLSVHAAREGRPAMIRH